MAKQTQTELGYDPLNEVIARMRDGVKWRWPVERGKTIFLLRPLTINEETEARDEVDQQMRKLGRRDDETHSLYMARAVLNRASSSFPGAQDATLSEVTLGEMSRFEVHAIYKEYLSQEERCNPSFDKTDPETLRRMVEALKKTPAEEMDLELTALSFWQLKALSISLVQEILLRDKLPGGPSTLS